MSLSKGRMQPHSGMLPHLKLVRIINHTDVEALPDTAPKLDVSSSPGQGDTAGRTNHQALQPA